LQKTPQKTITVTGEKLTKLEAKYNQEKASRPSLTFAGFIAESALMELERQNLLREAQFISFVGENNGIITLKDYRDDKQFIEVQVTDQGPICINDNGSKDCIHVGFVLALPEVRKRLPKQTA
jgi:hypothetical protein